MRPFEEEPIIIDAEILEETTWKENQKESASQGEKSFAYQDAVDERQEIFRSLIGMGNGYYEAEFAKISENRSALSFNLFATIFPIVWLVYRKMYQYGALFFIFNCLLMSFEHRMLLNLLCHIVFGLFANRIYRSYLLGIVDQAMSVAGEERELFIKVRSGTDPITACIVLAIHIVWWIIYFVFFKIFIGFLIGVINFFRSLS